jgi:formyltetrahydrofolate-dependent phosphoribosylglycinamide formyltransferase
MFARLKEKWKVNWLQFVLIFTTFALGGSLCARAGNWLLSFVLTEKSVLYWLIYVPLITVLWPLCVLMVSIPLGQFRFFSNYLKRIWYKITGRKTVKRIAIFASGTGTNARAIIDYFKNNPSVEVSLIATNKPHAGVLSVAAASEIPTLIVEKETFFKGNAYADELKSKRIDWIVLAGFLWKIPPALLKAYPQHIINIHPALLPKYGGKGMYGAFVHDAVLKAGETESGITIHYADELYDHGAVILQVKCPVLQDDTAETLASRIHELEHAYYPKTIEGLLQS